MRKLFLAIILFLCPLVLAADKPYRILNSFNAGKLTPLLSAREDLTKYQSGCSVMENVFPIPQGGAQKRPGTIYVAESKNNTKIRLLPFEYSTEQSYIIELGNQYARFYTDAAQLTSGDGTEDLSALDNIVGHWLLNDDVANTTVLDDDGATHNATATANTNTLSETGKVGTGCFNLAGAYAAYVADHGDFTFIEGTNGTFTIAAWVYITSNSPSATIISKWDSNNQREWHLYVDTTNNLKMRIYDETNNQEISKVTTSPLTNGWHLIVVYYNGGGAGWTAGTAANYIAFFVDTVSVPATGTNNASYVKMADTTSNFAIGARYTTGALDKFWPDKIDEVALFNDVLTESERNSLWTEAAYELTTPYLTADLFELKFEQSADVLYITHPDYETRKLSRLGDTDWTLEVLGIDNGPFRTQNTTTTATIAASATTGSVTLTATGCTPFVAHETTGHIPSGSAATSKSQTGALFKIVHPLAELEYETSLEKKYDDDANSSVSWTACGTLYKGSAWMLETQETWTGTLEVQRNYTIGAAHDAAGWGSVFEYSSNDNRNTITGWTEEENNDASYRYILTDAPGAGTTCHVYFSTDQTDHIGIVEITAVASPISATGTVVKTLGSTDATHKWSEGSWSNYRGWPATVTFFEDRLTFGGNTSQPDTIWGSVTADYENMLAGADDDDAIVFTLSSKQVNAIQWLVGKDKIMIGTSGAEWTLSGSADEPLTPSNVKAEQQSTYGSENLQAILASESVLFFQENAKKMRELAYNWELDTYVAPDMTILSKEITGDGITDMAFQQTPDSILWCIRDDGDIASFAYERKEQITSWSEQITDGDFESVAVIHGDTEDEVWVSVERTIDNSTVRYIEYFSTRDFGSEPNDAFYVDCGATYTNTSSITDLDWLEGETVYVLADGDVHDSETVDSNTITLDDTYATVQVGLPYTVQIETMPLSWVATGTTIQGRIKRINEVIARWYDSGDFYIGKDVDNKELYSISRITTSEDRKTFPPGYDRSGGIFIYQQSPEPLTLLALMIEFMVY